MNNLYLFSLPTTQYGAAILLIRNPYDAFVSFYKFQETVRNKSVLNPHTSKVDKSMFGE